MKENIKVGILVFLIIFFIAFFASTKGNDQFNIDFGSNNETVSYEIAASEYNGVYKNNKDNSVYALVGLNNDGTYRIHFVQTTAGIKKVMLELNNSSFENGSLNFEDSKNNSLELNLGKKDITVRAEFGSLGNEKLEGFYPKIKNISTFSLSEIEL